MTNVSRISLIFLSVLCLALLLSTALLASTALTQTDRLAEMPCSRRL